MTINNRSLRRFIASAFSVLIAGFPLASSYAGSAHIRGPRAFVRPAAGLNVHAVPNFVSPVAQAPTIVTAVPALRPIPAIAAGQAPGEVPAAKNTLGGLKSAQERVVREKANPQIALDSLFSGSSRGSKDESPVPGEPGKSKCDAGGCPGSGRMVDPDPEPPAEPPKEPEPAPVYDPIGEFVHAAIKLYHPGLAPGRTPAVVTRKALRPEGVPTDDEMLGNVSASPKTNPEREQVAIRLFQKGGAKYDPETAPVASPDFTRDGEVQVQEVPGWGGKAAHNIFVVKKGHPKPGQKERVIVVSSHNDKVDVGDGVIDNWTGTTMVAHLHQSIKDQDTEATYLFIAFAREEEGLVGSKHFLKSMTPAQRAMLEGNTNYDTIAIKGGGTNSWENNSDQVLLAAADKAVAEANKTRGPNEQLSLVRDQLNGGDADSSSFRRQRPPIPGMTIYSGPEDLIFSIIHSANDNIGAFDFGLYKNTYQVAMAIIRWLEGHPLGPASSVGNES